MQLTGAMYLHQNGERVPELQNLPPVRTGDNAAGGLFRGLTIVAVVKFFRFSFVE